MNEISRYLFLAGALPFLVLGLAHALATPLDPEQARAALVSGLYLALAIRFWFRTPIVGVALSSACFLVSWAFFLLRG